MEKADPLPNLVERLNVEFKLSEEFKSSLPFYDSSVRWISLS
jgi:hypothetical protein